MAWNRGRFFLLLHLLAIFKFIYATSGRKQPSIEIHTLYKPEDCDYKAEENDVVFVHYTGYLDDGKMFGSTLNKPPMRVEVGEKMGLSSGVRGMCVGEKRQIIVPPELAYGKEGYPPVIPPQATLTFEVEVMSIKSDRSEELVFRFLRFLVAPVAAICIVMYLYSKYQKFPTKKELKELKKNKKNK